MNDPTINKAIDKGVTVPADQRASYWGKLDDQISAQAPAIPWVWDNEGYVRSTDVNGVVNLFNTINYGKYDSWVGGAGTANIYGGDNANFGVPAAISGPMRTVKLSMRYAF